MKISKERLRQIIKEELAKPTVFMKKERGHKNYFEDTYKDLTTEQFKLLFGKWS